MVSDLFFYELLLLGLLWLCVMLYYAGPSDHSAGDQRTSKPLPPSHKRSSDSKPFPGLTRTPPCAVCEQAHEHVSQPPGCPPPHIVPTRGRPRQVATSFHLVVSLQLAAKYKRSAWRPLPGQKGADHRAIMVSQRSSAR